ncbi:MAG TPA: cellulose biosynthesis protein BcsG [Paraburkholderia sp.]|uniref:cellulose biosynthesis protein BcsG n=1 Tax=Paraburkholderia sp. TaxID=1926495 RepID=UPI002ED34C36
MSLWNLYFLLKLYLFSAGHLHPLWLANIAFAIALAATSGLRNRFLRVLRVVIGLVLGVMLMYHEAAIPPFSRLVEEFGNLETFRFGYWMELAQRFVPPAALLVACCAVVGYLVVNRWLRVTSFVILALVALPVWQASTNALSSIEAAASLRSGAKDGGVAQPGAPLDHTAALASFRAGESQRQVAMAHLTNNPGEQFDVIVLHVCSLSWDDLDVSNARNNPMLSHFDYLFSNFSTAASYSGPAAIRVLRATCGQEAHADLYKPAAQQCHLFAQLAQAGYSPQTILNHDGHFDNFLEVIKDNLGVPNVPMISNTDVPVAMHAFDGSPIHDDYGVLAKWFAQRQQIAGPVALYYNTISLHDGNQLPGSSQTSLQSYPGRVNKLMNDFDRLGDLIAASGRRAVIVFVPEHGAALRGDANQVAGLREIPTPRIVHGPVGVRLINFPGNHAPTTVIDKPTSFLAVAQLLSNLVSNSPFKPGVTLSQYAADLPQTDMVGENEGTVTMKTASGYVVKTPDGVWVDEK